MNPYYIVKTAEDFYADEAAAPLIGALIGGGIGAYTGKDWTSKLLRGLAGAGIGGGIGMGANWIRNRLGYGQAAKAQREQFNSLQKELDDTQKQHADLRNDVEEIYKNLYGFVGYNPENKPTLKDALSDITQSLESRKVITEPLGISTFNRDLLPEGVENRTVAEILGVPEIKRLQDTQRYKDLADQPVYYETFTPINKLRFPENRVPSKYYPAYYAKFKTFRDFPKLFTTPAAYKDSGKLEEFQLPGNLPDLSLPNKHFYSTDLINPVIGALLGTGIGAYTGKDKKSKIKRGLIGLLLGGGMGLGANWIKDKLNASQFKLNQSAAENAFISHIEAYKPELSDISKNINQLYKSLNGKNNRLTTKEKAEKLKNYTKELAYLPYDKWAPLNYYQYKEGVEELMPDMVLWDFDPTKTYDNSKKNDTVRKMFQEVSPFNRQEEVNTLLQEIRGEISRPKSSLGPLTLSVLKTATPEEISDVITEKEIGISTAINVLNKLDYRYTSDAEKYLNDLKNGILFDIAQDIHAKRRKNDPAYQQWEKLDRKPTPEGWWDQYNFNREKARLAKIWESKYPYLYDEAIKNPDHVNYDIIQKIIGILRTHWENGEDYPMRFPRKSLYARARALSKDKLPTIDEY